MPRVAVLAVAFALGACATSGSPPAGRGDAAAVPPAAPGPDAGSVAAAGVGTLPGQGGDGGADGDGRVADEALPVLPPALDADRDRIADTLDDCPDSEPDEIVDEAGCPLFTRVLDGVVFAPNDHRLGAASRLALASLVTDLEAHPGVVVRLEGHTDNRGTAATNLELSKRRVMSVARFLVARGVEPARLKPYGFGESRPRAGNATAPGRERNRRIEIGLESRVP